MSFKEPLPASLTFAPRAFACENHSDLNFCNYFANFPTVVFELATTASDS